MADRASRILVASANANWLSGTSQILQAAGSKVAEATSGADALNVAQTGVDLVAIDVKLPDIDGFEIARRLRTSEANSRVPIVYVSDTFLQSSQPTRSPNRQLDGFATYATEPLVLTAIVRTLLRARQVEDEKHEAEQEFQAVFESALNGIFVMSAQRTFIDANPALCGILQRSREDLVGRSIREFIPGERSDEANELLKRLDLHGAWRGIFPLKRADGQLVYLDWNMSIHSAPNVWLVIVSDITAQLKFEREREELHLSERLARAEAERAVRLKEGFLATLSHELRTPLNAIVGWSQLLQLGQLQPHEAKEALEAIDRNAKLQAQMIADLLDVSSITSGKLRLDVQTIDPATFVDAALEAIAPAAEAKEIGITKILDAQASDVSGDPARLQQIVWNLVSNAVKFTPVGGRIRVKLARINSHVEISVADNGQGIDAETLPGIFESFRSGDESTARAQPGLGMGLTISKQLVELHGGTIRAESAGPDRGATFTVTLPVQTAKPRKDATPAVRTVPEPTASKSPNADLDGIRVLIVDDDADARRLTRRVLADFGAEPRVADGVTQALTALDEFRPHVLVSDLGMPTVDGFELIRRVRAMGYSFQDLPAVALTAYARTEDRRKALLAGFQLHLTKPVDPTELSAAVATLVGRTG